MMAKAVLISESFVRPKNEVDESKRIYDLNPFHLRLLLLDYVQLGYLFSKPSNFSPFSYLQLLRFSLSQALVHFYPLAGLLVTVPNHVHHSCCIHVDCCMGPGARLIHASAQHLSVVQVTRRDLNVPEVVRSFFDLGEFKINHDGHTKPLLSAQVTELLDGVFMGISINHSVMDGISIFHFQRVWSHILMGTFSASVPLPIFDKPDFIDGKVIKLPYVDPDEFVIRPIAMKTEGELLSRRFFKFSAKSLRHLKTMANTEAEAYKMISTFEALIAFVWKCITRARTLPSDELTTIGLPINLRPRLKPPLTDNYFGNYMLKKRVSAKVGDLINNSVGWAATLLQQGVAAQDDTAARAFVKQAIEKGIELLPPTQTLRSSNVNVGGSTRFDVNENQFGLGKLAAFREGYGNKSDGKVNAFLGSEGDGSVDLDVCLVPQTMSALLSDQQFMSFTSLHNAHFNLISKV